MVRDSIIPCRDVGLPQVVGSTKMRDLEPPCYRIAQAELGLRDTDIESFFFNGGLGSFLQ